MPGLNSALTFSTNLYDKPPSQGGVLVNAQMVTLTIIKPDGTSSTPTITNPPTLTGVYGYTLASATQYGRWVGVWSFTMVGGAIGTYTQTFNVDVLDPGSILGLSDAKSHLNIPDDDTSNDDEILKWLYAITPVIEDMIGACVPRTVVEYQDSARRLRLNVTPVLSITSIVPYLTAGFTYAPGLVKVTPDGRVMLLSGLSFLNGPFEVTYRVGRIPIPANVIQAAKIILTHLWETQRGVTGLPLQGGDDLALIPGLGFTIPNRALELLRPLDLGPGVG